MYSYNKENYPNLYCQYIDYQDTDAGGVVYHTRYIDFAERARSKLFREVFTNKSFNNYLWVVADLSVQFIIPAKLGDFITLKTVVKEVKHCSIIFLQNIFIKNKLSVTMLVKVASLNQDFKVTKFSKEIKDKLSNIMENYSNEQ